MTMGKSIFSFIMICICSVFLGCSGGGGGGGGNGSSDQGGGDETIDLFSTRGDGICQEGETLICCPGDCNVKVKSYVEVKNNRPVLIVNEQETPFIGLTLYNPDNISCAVPYRNPGWVDFIKEQIDKVHATGATYLNFDVPLVSLYKGEEPPSSTDASDPSNWDTEKLSQVFDYAVSAGVYLILDFNPHNPPSWWSGQNSDQLHLDNGNPPTEWNMAGFNNPTYWDVMDPYIEGFVNIFKNQPALLGWYVRGGITGENNYPPSYLTDLFGTQTTWCDFSDFATARFQQWLVNKYGTIGALNSKWQTTYTGFNETSPPDPLDDVATLLEQLEIENGAGDRRPSFMDWHQFRLDEKTADFNHFFDLVEAADPDHIILTDPAFKPLQNGSTQSGTGDGFLRYAYKSVDGILHHPRVSFDDEPGSFNVNRNEYYQVVHYAGLNEKLSSWVNEDAGELNRCMDTLGSISSFDDCCSTSLDSDACIDPYATVSESRITSIAGMLAAEGGGCGWVVGGTCLDNPTWNEEERGVIKRMNTLFSIRDITAPSSKIAVLSDPYSEDLFYQKGTHPDYNRRTERDLFLDTLFAHGLSYTGMTVADLINDSLDSYDAIVLLHLPVISTEVLTKLIQFRDDRGGLFIIGRCGVYDKTGQVDYSALSTLVGCAANCITDDMEVPARPQTLAWSFVETDVHNLLTGITGTDMVSDSFIKIPVFDLAGNGFTSLGYLDDFPTVSPAGIKGNTLFWFSSLGSHEKLPDFLKNVWRFYGVNTPDPEYDLEMYGGNYIYHLAAAAGSYQVRYDLSHNNDYDGNTILMWDWISMTEVGRGESETQNGKITFDATLSLTADTPVFAGFTPLDGQIRLVALSGGSLYKIEEATGRLSVGIAQVVSGDSVTLVYTSGGTVPKVTLNGANIVSDTLSPDGTVGILVVDQISSVCTISLTDESNVLE